MLDDRSKRKELEPENNSQSEKKPFRDAECDRCWDDSEADSHESNHHAKPNCPPTDDTPLEPASNPHFQLRAGVRTNKTSHNEPDNRAGP